MTWGLQDWAALATIVSTIWFVGTTVSVWRQLRLQHSSADTDRRRFLRESITVMHETLQDHEFRRVRRQFFSAKRDFTALSDEQKDSARSFLDIYGVIARMVDEGAIEERQVRDFWRGPFFRDWERLAWFVEADRQRSNNQNLFKAAEMLAQRWKPADA